MPKLPANPMRPKHDLWLSSHHLVDHKFAHADLKRETYRPISRSLAKCVHDRIWFTFLSLGANLQAARPTDESRCSLHNLFEAKRSERKTESKTEFTSQNGWTEEVFPGNLRYRKRNQRRFYLRRSSQLRIFNKNAWILFMMEKRDAEMDFPEEKNH